MGSRSWAWALAAFAWAANTIAIAIALSSSGSKNGIVLPEDVLVVAVPLWVLTTGILLSMLQRANRRKSIHQARARDCALQPGRISGPPGVTDPEPMLHFVDPSGRENDPIARIISLRPVVNGTSARLLWSPHPNPKHSTDFSLSESCQATVFGLRTSFGGAWAKLPDGTWLEMQLRPVNGLPRLILDWFPRFRSRVSETFGPRGTWLGLVSRGIVKHWNTISVLFIPVATATAMILLRSVATPILAIVTFVGVALWYRRTTRRATPLQVGPQGLIQSTWYCRVRIPWSALAGPPRLEFVADLYPWEDEERWRALTGSDEDFTDDSENGSFYHDDVQPAKIPADPATNKECEILLILRFQGESEPAELSLSNFADAMRWEWNHERSRLERRPKPNAQAPEQVAAAVAEVLSWQHVLDDAYRLANPARPDPGAVAFTVAAFTRPNWRSCLDVTLWVAAIAFGGIITS